jgi:NUMOD3 motif.
MDYNALAKKGWVTRRANGKAIAWNKGIQHTPETRAKIKEARKHQVFSPETRKKLSDMRKGKPNGLLGFKHTEETKNKMSESHQGLFQGEKNPNWKGGITPERVKAWHSEQYKQWRTAVFERDYYTCIWCKQVGGRLNADHILPWAIHPEWRFEINNGRTLCVDCHRKTNTYGHKTKNMVQLINHGQNKYYG